MRALILGQLAAMAFAALAGPAFAQMGEAPIAAGPCPAESRSARFGECRGRGAGGLRAQGEHRRRWASGATHLGRAAWGG